MPENRVVLTGSERSALKDAKILGDVSPDERFTVTVVLKPMKPVTARTKRILSHEEFEASHGAPASAIAAVRTFAQGYGLTVVAESAAKRTVELAGTAAAMKTAFGVSLQRAEYQGRMIRHRVGPIKLPADLAPLVVAVLGLDNRPQATHNSAVVDTRLTPNVGTTLTPPQAAKLYNFPTGVNGTGQIVAIIELGGGFAQADLNTYFSGLGITPTPSVTAVSVSASNSPGTDTNADSEVMLDIEVVGGVAPGAKQLVYFAQNTDQDFINAVLAAANATPAPTAISISWGGSEGGWSSQAMASMTQAFQDADALGSVVFVATGDKGSSNGTSALTVQFPASSPAATACGGTTVIASGNTISSEVVWDDGPTASSGGGVSQIYPKPSFQSGINVPPPPSGTTGGRGIPDVSGHASAWQIRADGSNTVVGGTSAVAPLWAGLAALLAQKMNKRLGATSAFNNLIYQSSVSSTFHDITQGTNDSTGTLGKYSAGPGWDPCTGLGSPNGTALLAALTTVQPPTPTPPTPTPTPHPTPTPTPHPTPTPTPHPTPTPTPHPTPTPPTPTSGGHTGTTGHAAFNVGELPPPYPYPVPAPVEPPPPTPPAGPTFFSGGNTVAIVGVVGLAALMGMVAATGVVAVVAINKDKS